MASVPPISEHSCFILCGTLPTRESKYWAPVTACEVTWKNTEEPLPYLFEMNERTISNEVDKASRQHRIHMIETATTEANIFSLSFIPQTPSVCQTWFYKKTHGLSLSWNITLFSEEPHLNWQPINLTGFVAPFPDFYSYYMPTIDPQNLPPAISRVVISRLEDIPTATADILSESLRAKVRTILHYFLHDRHARGLGILLLQPETSSVQQKLFFKA